MAGCSQAIILYREYERHSRTNTQFRTAAAKLRPATRQANRAAARWRSLGADALGIKVVGLARDRDAHRLHMILGGILVAIAENSHDVARLGRCGREARAGSLTRIAELDKPYRPTRIGDMQRRMRRRHGDVFDGALQRALLVDCPGPAMVRPSGGDGETDRCDG